MGVCDDYVEERRRERRRKGRVEVSGDSCGGKDKRSNRKGREE